jgi:uncharacterized protein (DUF3084 family)
MEVGSAIAITGVSISSAMLGITIIMKVLPKKNGANGTDAYNAALCKKSHDALDNKLQDVDDKLDNVEFERVALEEKTEKARSDLAAKVEADRREISAKLTDDRKELVDFLKRIESKIDGHISYHLKA